MKKLLVLVFAILLVSVFSACGGANRNISSVKSTVSSNDRISSDNGDVISKIAESFVPNNASFALNSTDKQKISVENAKNIALEHAGFNANQVEFLRAELDFDDGVYKYEIEFEKDRFEYDYDIEAYSGKILKSEKDREDFD